MKIHSTLPKKNITYDDYSTCICLAPTGMVPTKNTTPYVPVDPKEIIEEVLVAADVGATYVHLHARDENGFPTQDLDRYSEIVSGIRKYNTEIPICLSLSGRTEKNPKIRAAPLYLEGELKPDMGSLTLSSLNFISQESINSPNTIEYLAKVMLEKGIKPELEVFDIGMVNYAKFLMKNRQITPPYFFNILLGNIASAQLSAIELGTICSMLPCDAFWSIAGIGSAQLSATAIGIALGGGVRIGLEDSIWYDRKRKKHATNLLLLKRTLAILDIHERRPLTSKEFRIRMGLKAGNGQYGIAS